MKRHQIRVLKKPSNHYLIAWLFIYTHLLGVQILLRKRVAPIYSGKALSLFKEY